MALHSCHDGNVLQATKSCAIPFVRPTKIPGPTRSGNTQKERSCGCGTKTQNRHNTPWCHAGLPRWGSIFVRLPGVFDIDLLL
jgi:hypothetical protein